MEGFLMPKPAEISMGRATLGAERVRARVIQLRADLDAPTGFAALLPHGGAEGLDAQRRRGDAGIRPGSSLSPGDAHRPLSAFLDKAP